MAEFGSGHGEFKRARQAQMAVECGVRRLKQYRSVMELPESVSSAPFGATTGSLLRETRRLEVALLECRSRIGDGPFDDYLELIEAHIAIDVYVHRVLPCATFVRARLDWSQTPPPEAELDQLIEIVGVLLDELARIDSETL